MKAAEVAKMKAAAHTAVMETLKTWTNEQTHPEWYLNSTQKFNMSCLGLAPTWIHKREQCKKCVAKDREREA